MGMQITKTSSMRITVKAIIKDKVVFFSFHFSSLSLILVLSSLYFCLFSNFESPLFSLSLKRRDCNNIEKTHNVPIECSNAIDFNEGYLSSSNTKSERLAEDGFEKGQQTDYNEKGQFSDFNEKKQHTVYNEKRQQTDYNEKRQIVNTLLSPRSQFPVSSWRLGCHYP
jgi:hypothetical protein